MFNNRSDSLQRRHNSPPGPDTGSEDGTLLAGVGAPADAGPDDDIDIDDAFTEYVGEMGTRQQWLFVMASAPWFPGAFLTYNLAFAGARQTQTPAGYHKPCRGPSTCLACTSGGRCALATLHLMQHPCHALSMINCSVRIAHSSIRPVHTCAAGKWLLPRHFAGSQPPRMQPSELCAQEGTQ